MVNREDIIRMAREAGMVVVDDQYSLLPFLERFAALVAAAEREACAKVCEAERRLGIDDERAYYGGLMAAAIRARGLK